MAKKVQLQTNGKEWQVIDGEQVLVDAEKQDIDPITSSSCVQLEGFRTLEEAVSDNKMLSQDLTYTKVMDKVGGDYHQNVLDGQYSKAILYGNTQVNLCEEDSSNALQIPTTFTSFNNGELQIKNKESQVVAPLIKGVTMVNLAQTTSSSITSGNGLPIHNVKGNTLYTLSFKFTTKNTNSGVVIQSYDANGTYLENTMHKTELGDVVKFTFTTHANATKVHICNNAAYGGETIQLDEIMLIEGDQTALDVPFFKGMRSVELSRPLTNLFTDTTPSIIGGVTVTNSNGTVVATSVAIDRYRSVQYKPEFKANTDYVVIWDTLTYTHTVTSDDTVCICKNDTVIANPVSSSFIFKNRSIKFNTGSKPSTITLRIHVTLGNTETATTTVTGLRVFEYDDYLRSIDLQSIGWFSGTKNVAVEPIKTCSKNLYPYGDINFTSASANMWCDAKGNQYMYTDIASKSKARFLLRKGTYIFTSGTISNIEAVALTDDKNEKTYYSGTPFVLAQDTYLSLVLKTVNANTLTTVSNIQIEHGATVTDYVAHDSRYYEPNGQNAIVLRSLPSGVCDTFNLQTGEYTRRIGEVILDGSDNGIVYTYHSNTAASEDTSLKTCRWFVQNNIEPVKNVDDENDNTVSICDKLKYSYVYYDEQDCEGFFISNKDNRIFFKTEKSKLNSLNTEGVKQYLQQNPITVQYELDTPITTIIPRTIKRNNNGTVSTVDFGTYTNKESLVIPNNPSYLTINSMTSIKPVVEPITYIDFKTRLKTNTDYSVIIDKDSANKTINLGGTAKTYADKMLVRTPSIDLEQNLRISGNGSIQNIMVIEGDVLDKELPYFNGMCNVKMPIVRNCGKNLFDINDDNFELGYIDTSGNITLKDRSSDFVKMNNGFSVNVNVMYGGVVSPFIKVKPNTSYKFSYEQVGSFASQNHFAFYNSEKKIINFIGEKNLGYQLVTPNSCEYIRIGFWLFNPGVIQYKNIQLEQGIASTSYEPYRGNDICIVEDNVALRSLPNGVKDELNLLTGEYIQRVGEVVLDGSEDWVASDVISKRYSLDLYATMNAVIDKTKILCICDKIQSITTNQSDNDKMLGITITNGNRVMINTNYDTINEFKNWLSQNPITVQYELAEPIISYPRIVSNTQEREIGVKLPNGVCDTYNPSTGITVKRVGFIEFDGSEDWHEPFVMADRGAVDMYGIWTEQPLCDAKPAPTTERIPGVCDSLNFKNSFIDLTNEEFYFISPSGRFNMNLSRSKLSEPTEQALKTYLSQNPIKLWYELKNPIVTTDIVLPNGVHDEYNPLTGLYTKRVGYIELDGSETWGVDPGYTPTANLIRFSSPIGDMKLQYNNNGVLLCDKLPVVQEGVVPCIYNRWNNYIYLDFKASDINVSFGTDSHEVMVTKLKTYLSQNPLKVWYELQTPITYQLTPYFGLPMPYAYKDGYLIMDSAYEGQTLPPEITYQLTVNRTGQITQNNIKLKEHTDRLSNLEYMLIEATLDSIFDREMQNFELELMNIELPSLDE